MSAATTVIKTLEATLAPPTAHKERRLRRTEATYRRALRDAFVSGADTQTTVNDVVTDYSGSEAKAHRFRGGMKPTTGNLSTLIATAGVGCLRNIFT